MLGSLFKPGWKSDSIEKRILAIEKMDANDEVNQTIFESIVTDDSSYQVRCAALARLTKPATVFQISNTHLDAKTQECARAVLASLIGPKSVLSEAQFRVLSEEQPEISQLLLCSCPYPSLRDELIDASADQDLAEIIATVEYTETRQRIANRLSQQSDLELARKQLRGKDKSAEKIIKAKLDDLHAEQSLVEERYQAAQAICEQMEYFASHEWRPYFRTKHDIWHQRWLALDFEPHSELRARYNAANEKVSALCEHDAAVEQAGQQQQHLVHHLNDYCQRISSLSLEDLVNTKSEHLDCLQAALKAWKTASDISTPPANLTEQFLNVERALSSLTEFCNLLADMPMFQGNTPTTDEGALPQQQQKTVLRLRSSLQDLHWPKPFPALNAKAEAKNLLSATQAQISQDKQVYSDQIDKLHKRINRLLNTTKRGDLGQANRELAAVSKAAGKITGSDKIALDERLLEATESVRKMGDWRDFATEPKLLALCEKMEALEASNQHPDKLASKIADLQKRWKDLGYSDIADQYWPRFKAAGDRAYEPCASFFKQRQATRKQNLLDREPIVEQMRSLLQDTDWEQSVDYKSVETQLQQIGSAWQKIKDVERAAGQKQWERLSALKAGVYEKLDVVYDANIELKNALIAQVKVMLESEVSEDALAKLQFYQSKWKQIGITRRKQDQAAWKHFKKSTDAVFEKIKGARNAKRAQDDEQVQRYRNITNQLNQLAKSATELAHADSEFERLQAEYQALPPLPEALPEKITKGLDSDFQKAQRVYDKARARIQQQNRHSELDALTQKAEICTQIESLGPDGEHSKIAALKEALDAITLDNNQLNKRFEQRLAALEDSNREAATEQRRLLCIDLEILLARKSPPEDAALRTRIQLERMQTQGIGHVQSEQQEQIEELRIAWLCLPGAAPESQQELDRRFQALVKSA